MRQQLILFFFSTGDQLIQHNLIEKSVFFINVKYPLCHILNIPMLSAIFMDFLFFSISLFHPQIA